MADHFPNAGNMTGYRRLKPGEVIESGDQYISVHAPGYVPVKECSIGQEILACNAPYYRRKRLEVAHA